jgi:hypothetical protein
LLPIVETQRPETQGPNADRPHCIQKIVREIPDRARLEQRPAYYAGNRIHEISSLI